jgi:biopolymer transport protein ExbD
MKIKRAPSSDKVDLNMTPMIDIVFQLMTFFLFSIKTVSSEGSFAVKMPIAVPQNIKPLDDPKLPKTLALTADANGWLTAVTFLGQKYPVPPPINKPGQNAEDPEQDFAHADNVFNLVHQQVLALVGNTSGPGAAGTPEIELDCSANLKYNYVIQAINTISGHRQKDGTVKPLLDKFRLKPQVK